MVGRGFASIEDSVDTSIQVLEDYIQKLGGRLIAVSRNNTNDTRTSRTTITRKYQWEEKQFYGRFKQLTSDSTHEKTWTGLRKGNVKQESESLLIAAQNNAIWTNHIKARIDKTQQNSRCRLCSDRDEIINHIIIEYSKLAQKDDKTMHDWTGKVIRWELCKTLKFDNTNKWYNHNPESVLENDIDTLFNFQIQTDHQILEDDQTL